MKASLTDEEKEAIWSLIDDLSSVERSTIAEGMPEQLINLDEDYERSEDPEKHSGALFQYLANVYTEVDADIDTFVQGIRSQNPFPDD